MLVARRRDGEPIAARLLRRGAGPRRRPATRAPSWWRSTSPSTTRGRSSTSAPPSVGALRHAGRGLRGGASASARMPLAELAAPAARARARGRRRSTPSRPTSFEILERDRHARRPRCAALYAPGGPRCCATGERVPPARARRRARAARRPRARGRSTTGDIAAAVVATGSPSSGGLLTREDLAAYEVVAREPVRGALPRPRGADQPAAVGGRHPDRLALACSTRDGAGAAARRATLVAAMDGRAGASARRSSSTGLARAGLRSSASSPARLGSTTHISRARRRRRRVQRHLLQRRGLGRSSCPAPASTSTTCWARRTSTRSASTAPARAPDAEHDGADRRAARRRARAGARQRGLEPHPLGDPADDRRRRRPRACARDDGGARAARCTSRTASSTPSRASTRPRSRPTGTRIAALPRANLFFGGVQAVERDSPTGAFSGGGDPRRGGAVGGGVRRRLERVAGVALALAVAWRSPAAAPTTRDLFVAHAHRLAAGRASCSCSSTTTGRVRCNGGAARRSARCAAARRARHRDRRSTERPARTSSSRAARGAAALPPATPDGGRSRSATPTRAGRPELGRSSRSRGRVAMMSVGWRDDVCCEFTDDWCRPVRSIVHESMRDGGCSGVVAAAALTGRAPGATLPVGSISHALRHIASAGRPEQVHLITRRGGLVAAALSRPVRDIGPSR